MIFGNFINPEKDVKKIKMNIIQSMIYYRTFQIS
jgi:hypothetical protein